MLNSLYRADLSLYARLLLKCFGEYSFERYKILYYSALMVKKYCLSLSEKENLDVEIWNEETYGGLLTLLFSGKACCHLENEEKYDWVRGYYDKMKMEYVEKFRTRQ